LRADSDAPAEWKRAARALLIAALAAGGQAEAAERMLNETPVGTVAEGLELVDVLAAVRSRAPSGAKQPLAELEMAAIDDLLARRDELEPASAKSLARRRVATLVEFGRRDEAVAGLTALAQEFPQDGQLQEDLANFLARGKDEESVRAALAKWRDVVGHCRPGSPRWFRAHLAIARLQLDGGNASQARSTIKLVESSHPDFGSPEMKARYLQLLAECER
jgi:hypothetical protein